MPELDMNNKVEITTTEITTTKKGCIVGTIGSSSEIGLLYDNVSILRSMPSEKANGCIHFVPSGVSLKISSASGTNNHIYFVPYITT